MELTDSEFEKLLKDTLSSNEEPSDILKAKLNKRLDEKIRNKKSAGFFDINSFRGLKTAAAAAIVVVTTVGIVTNSDNPVPASNNQKTPYQQSIVSTGTMIIDDSGETKINEKTDEVQIVKKNDSSKTAPVKETVEKKDTQVLEDVSVPQMINEEENLAVASNVEDYAIGESAYTPPEDMQENSGGGARSAIDFQMADEDVGVVFEAFKIETDVREITKSGLTLIVNHNGNETGSKVSTGADFYVESLKNEEWMPLKTFEDEVGWDMIAYSLDNENNEIVINWGNIYGELSDGKYRIIKHFTVTTSENIDDRYTDVTEFEIN